YTLVVFLRWGVGLTLFGLVVVCFVFACYPMKTKSFCLVGGGFAGLYRAKELGRSRIVSFGRLKTS
ncbi:hypothetical protein V6699_22985, partial [Klebsiella pneumoniae]